MFLQICQVEKLTLFAYRFCVHSAMIDTKECLNSSLADFYDELTMPPELRKAHQHNDRAVMEAYGFSVKDMTESKCVVELMKLYQKLTES